MRILQYICINPYLSMCFPFLCNQSVLCGYFSNRLNPVSFLNKDATTIDCVFHGQYNRKLSMNWVVYIWVSWTIYLSWSNRYHLIIKIHLIQTIGSDIQHRNGFIWNEAWRFCNLFMFIPRKDLLVVALSICFSLSDHTTPSVSWHMSLIHLGVKILFTYYT